MTIKKRALLYPIILLPIIALVTVVLLLRFGSHKLSELEYISFREKTEDVSYFLEMFDPEIKTDEDNNEEMTEDETKLDYLAKQTSVAAQLHFAETGEDSIELSKTIEIINNHFSTQVSEQDYESELINEFLKTYNVGYDSDEKQIYFNNPYCTKQGVAVTPIDKYILTDVKRKGEAYTAIYDYYQIDGPYAALNRTSQDDITGKHSVRSYLDGRGTPIAIKELLTPENIKDIATSERSVKVTYVLSDDRILLNTVNSK